MPLFEKKDQLCFFFYAEIICADLHKGIDISLNRKNEKVFLFSIENWRSRERTAHLKKRQRGFRSAVPFVAQFDGNVTNKQSNTKKKQTLSLSLKTMRFYPLAVDGRPFDDHGLGGPFRDDDDVKPPKKKRIERQTEANRLAVNKAIRLVAPPQPINVNEAAALVLRWSRFSEFRGGVFWHFSGNTGWPVYIYNDSINYNDITTSFLPFDRVLRVPPRITKS